MPGAPDLVIFDCDGVLVDSEPLSMAVLRDVLAEAGVAIGEDEAYERFLGRSMSTIAEIIRRDFDLAITQDHLERIRLDLFERFRAGLKPVPGIAEALKRLTAAHCVASSSQPERIRLSLRVTGLLELLEPRIYSATMVKRGKPFPDLFLHAAAEMRADPRRTVVVEDSPAGITAAKAAGMRVFAFTGASHAARPGFRDGLAALQPDLVFNDMRRLPDLLVGAASHAAS